MSEEAGRRRPGRVGQAPSRLADEQAAAAADAPNRRRAASAPPERQRAAQQPRLVPALSTRKAENLHVRAAALKVHPIALENVYSGYWYERSAASRGTAEAAFRTLGESLIDVPLGASDEERKKLLIEKGQHQAAHGSLLGVVCAVATAARRSGRIACYSSLAVPRTPTATPSTTLPQWRSKSSKSYLRARAAS